MNQPGEGRFPRKWDDKLRCIITSAPKVNVDIVYLHSWELPHLYDTHSSIHWNLVSPIHFMKLFSPKVTDTSLLLIKIIDAFQVLSRLLSSIKLCWPFKKFPKVASLSSRTYSLSSLNLLVLSLWSARWVILPVSLTWMRCSPEFNPGSSSPSSSVYTLF